MLQSHAFGISAVLVALCGVACEPERSSATPPAPPTVPSIERSAFVADAPKLAQAVERSVSPSHPGSEPFSVEVQASIDAAFKALPKDYEPRTHHLGEDGSPLFTNRLIFERSPYLKQHAHNPVNWYAWGDEAFETAKRENKPLLLSIGYSTCHWCHVMEEESFEDLEIASTLNERYICIKVDREERPDVDAVYMTAVNLLTGRGGWPMTVWLTPSREPFMAGTYFPPRDGMRRRAKGFLTLILELSDEFASDPLGVAGKGKQLTSRLRRAMSTSGAGSSLPGEEALHGARASYERSFDVDYGGFGRGNKFPRPSNLDFLLRYFRRSGHKETQAIVVKTLDAMKDGGLYDHVDQGFHRYTTERRFRIPHFEKMLYDNAQLVVTYIEAFQLFGNPEYERVARETLDYVIRDMTSPEGGFYSATDADSEGEEGKFAVWTPEQVQKVVGGEGAPLINAYYNITPRGNFEHRTTVLHVTRPLAAVAKEVGLDRTVANRLFAAGRHSMFDARRKRIQPLKDDKILTAWNGLMISAFARAGRVLEEPKYTERAQKAARFLLTQLRDGAGLYRRYHSGEARFAGVLDDYAYLIAGLLDLFEADPDPRWLREALALQEVVENHFADPQGAYFMTSDNAEVLLARETPDYDGARPSGNSVTALNLSKLYALTGDDVHRVRAEMVLRHFGSRLSRGTTAQPKLLCALDFVLDRAIQVVLVEPEGKSAAELLKVLRETYSPNQVLVRVTEGAKQEALATVIPYVRDKLAFGGKPTAYVCEEGTCQRPATTATLLKKQLAKLMRAL